MRLGPDPSSYSQPDLVKIQHIDLDWNLLDVSDINIESVNVKANDCEVPLKFQISDTVPDIGSKLTIDLPTKTDGELILVIYYKTSPNASALQWLDAEQTSNKNHPFMFSQCQAIHARSIVPCQDSPSIKFTYSATVHHPPELVALMSAIRVGNQTGITKFEQKVPIPSYLLAIAVGDLYSKQVGPRSHVWAEKNVVDEAAAEFSDTETFIQTAEEICGPYLWKVYDLLVMPPSFPFGGMENPCLTFVTPTVIAGDKSLVDVVAHEISHSWTGNLVTNANFEHFWLNEGFTVFVEQKIIGRLRGSQYRDFHALHGLSELKDTFKNQLKNEPELTKLVVDLSNVGPDDAFSSVPYMKGSTFLRYMEDLFGGPTIFELFLKKYLDQFKYQSILTKDFKKYVYEYFNEKIPERLEEVDWDKWLYSEGMPVVIPNYDTTVYDTCKKHADLWSIATTADIKISPVIREELSSIQKIEFLSQLLDKSEIRDLNEAKIVLMAETYGFDNTKNSEIRFRLMRLIIKARLTDRFDEIFAFANSNFRMKFVRPIYRDLGEWTVGKPLAIANFLKVKDQMMKVCAYTVAKDLGINI
ncbi:CLUMA_CG019119, isoform A [Clunio marinus]|uniref:CLUMA_CG019119, isoform A n=1 Tax=Clunio marinus TaxID=568069 RepID=A0A1J1J2S3_9DIPT|nr:CLUMA_CG019119, isoform A [Clunio marinus]